MRNFAPVGRYITAFHLVFLLITPVVGQVCGPTSCELPPVSRNVPASNVPLPYPVPPAVVRVENRIRRSQPPAEMINLGSGAVIQDDTGNQYVITAAHLFADGVGVIRVTLQNRKELAARFVGNDTFWDVAVLRLDTPVEVKPLILSTKPATQGETVWAVGFGPNGVLRSVGGVVLGYTQLPGAKTYETLKITGKVRDGDSGGPVLDRNGELVGVVWGTDEDTIYSTFVGRVKTVLGGIPSVPAVVPKIPEIPKIPAVPTVPVVLKPRNETMFDMDGLILPLLSLLGISSPVVVGTYYLLRTYYRYRRRKRTAAVSTSTSLTVLPLNDEYGSQLNRLYELCGRTTESDATLGRLYDLKLADAEQSTSPEIARYVTQLRKDVARQFFRIHSTSPSPAEPVE